MVKFTYPKGKTGRFPICPIVLSYCTVQWPIKTVGPPGPSSWIRHCSIFQRIKSYAGISIFDNPVYFYHWWYC